MADLFSDLEIPPSTARISADGIYRYELRRHWSTGTRPVVFCGLNPSTADAIEDDQTILKDIGFGQRWHCNYLLKVNAFAFRTRHPELMKRAARSGVDIIGPENDLWIRGALDLVHELRGIFVAAWGNNIDDDRQAQIASIIAASGVVPLCLGTNKNGTPKHELYLSYETELVEWVPRAA